MLWFLKVFGPLSVEVPGDSPFELWAHLVEGPQAGLEAHRVVGLGSGDPTRLQLLSPLEPPEVVLEGDYCSAMAPSGSC